MLSTKPVNNLGKDTRSVTTQSGVTSVNQQVALVYSGTDRAQWAPEHCRSVQGEGWAAFSPRIP